VRVSAMRRLIGVVVGVSVVFGATNSLAAIRFKRIEYDPPGADTHNPDAEIVVIENTGEHIVRMRDWVLQEHRDGHEFAFPRFHLPAGERVRVHTGSSYSDTRHDVFMHAPFPFWNNHGDTATLVDEDGYRRDRCHYSGGDRSAIC
jgi:lamin tail-like protein